MVVCFVDAEGEEQGEGEGDDPAELEDDYDNPFAVAAKGGKGDGAEDKKAKEAELSHRVSLLFYAMKLDHGSAAAMEYLQVRHVNK
eukprot:63030-Pyramimonas_sp.AAC.1